VDLVAVLVVVGALGVVGLGLAQMGRERRDPHGRGLGEAAVEIDGLFAPQRKHTVEYFHAQEIRREEVLSADGGDDDGIGRAVRRVLEQPRAPETGPEQG
jgi:hypothetical protein